MTYVTIVRMEGQKRYRSDIEAVGIGGPYAGWYAGWYAYLQEPIWKFDGVSRRLQPEVRAGLLEAFGAFGLTFHLEDGEWVFRYG